MVLHRILLPYILDRGPSYGLFRSPLPSASGAAKVDADAGEMEINKGEGREAERKAVIEFSSPNLGQDFRTDHLRSTLLGAFVANAFDAMGWHVVRVNYLGDWGKHIGLLGLGWLQHGCDAVLDKHPDPFRHIHSIYAKMNEELEPRVAARRARMKRERHRGSDESTGGEEYIDDDDDDDADPVVAARNAAFKQLEDDDPAAVELWEKLRQISVGYYAAAYRRLGLVFDDYSGESLVCRNPETLVGVEAALREAGVAELAGDGSWIVDFAKHGGGDGTSVVLRARDGTTTYFLRDVATVMDRLEDYGFDQLVYVVVGEQERHLRRVFRAVELLGRPEVARRLRHVAFTRGPPLWGGDARTLGDIVDRCEEYIRRAVAEADPPQLPPHRRTPAALRAMAVNALVAQELGARNKAHTIGLDAELLMAVDGDTGLSLQLSYARLRGALEAFGADGDLDVGHDDYSMLCKTPWAELVRLLLRFPAITTAAFESLEPSTILSYLYQVADETNFCLDDEGLGVSSSNPKRAMVLRATRQVLENGMRLLNMVPFM